MILNTLRRSGGVDTRLKTINNVRLESVRKRELRYLMAIGIIVIISCALFYLMDIVYNGAFVDWFTNEFIYKHERMNEADGIYYVLTDMNWYKLKRFLLLGFIILFLIAYFVIILIENKRSKRYKERCLREISEQIREYMTKDLSAEQVFSSEYSEISMLMMDYKNKTQRHEQMLKEEADRKKDLITYLAHDLKTPLTSVIGYLSLLEEAYDMPQEQRKKYVHITLDKSLRLEKLINEFFEITRYNLQQISLDLERIDLYYLLFQMKDEFYPVLQEHKNTIELEADENLTVNGDAIKLARVFNNIIKNAVAYSDPETVILVKAEHEDDHTLIQISNRGKTIPAHKLERIFEKFFRLDEARSTNTGGAGLGLAIARDIVELHGGTIRATSDQGLTTFTVSLPDEREER